MTSCPPLILFKMSWIYCDTHLVLLLVTCDPCHCGAVLAADQPVIRTYSCFGFQAVQLHSHRRPLTLLCCWCRVTAGMDRGVFLVYWKSLNQTLASAADTQPCGGSGPAAVLPQNRRTQRPRDGRFRHWHHLISIDFNTCSFILKKRVRVRWKDLWYVVIDQFY